jgi:hypothetical protein
MEPSGRNPWQPVAMTSREKSVPAPLKRMKGPGQVARALRVLFRVRGQ